MKTDVRKSRKQLKKLLPEGSVFNERVEIGKGTRINGPITIKGEGNCEIGRYCAFGSDIRIITSNHSMNTANVQIKLQRRIGACDISEKGADVDIGHNVWIGDSAIILPGISIGHGAVIGAGAVVTRDVADFSVVAGCPAKLIKKRFSDQLIDELLQIQWWHWDEERMKRNVEFFNLDLTIVKGWTTADLIKD